MPLSKPQLYNFVKLFWRDSLQKGLGEMEKESAKNRRHIATLLNAYFSVLYFVTFDENGDFKDPAR